MWGLTRQKDPDCGNSNNDKAQRSVGLDKNEKPTIMRIIQKSKTEMVSAILNIVGLAAAFAVVTLRSLRAATVNPVRALRTE